MTGNTILKGAASLMGFNEPNDEMNNIGPTVINFVLEDLDKGGLENLDQEIELNETLASTAMAGVAMLLSVAIGDLRSKECFSAIYNEKRGKVKRSSSQVTDVLPKGELL